jgi:hypothetical protein
MSYLCRGAAGTLESNVGAGLMLNLQANRVLATFYVAGLKLMLMPMITFWLLLALGVSGWQLMWRCSMPVSPVRGTPTFWPGRWAETHRPWPP